MITLGKLKIFARYKGDIDMFGRAGSQSEKKIVSDEDWHLIDILLQDAVVIDRRLGSDRRTKEATNRIQTNCESNEVVSQVHQLAEKLSGPGRKFPWFI
jgi:hypothetical protein